MRPSKGKPCSRTMGAPPAGPWDWWGSGAGGAGHHLVGGDELVEDAGEVRLLGGHDLVGEEELAGALLSDEAGEEPRRAAVGAQAEAEIPCREPCVGAADACVRRQRKAQP